VKIPAGLSVAENPAHVHIEKNLYGQTRRQVCLHLIERHALLTHGVTLTDGDRLIL
jgi:hypothetical protein